MLNRILNVEVPVRLKAARTGVTPAYGRQKTVSRITEADNKNQFSILNIQ
jgi:hypothetical protein